MIVYLDGILNDSASLPTGIVHEKDYLSLTNQPNSKRCVIAFELDKSGSIKLTSVVSSSYSTKAKFADSLKPYK